MLQGKNIKKTPKNPSPPPPLATRKHKIKNEK
jgi:hypothetical protein